MGIVGIERKLEEKRKEMDKNISEVSERGREVETGMWRERVRSVSRARAKQVMGFPVLLGLDHALEMRPRPMIGLWPS